MLRIYQVNYKEMETSVLKSLPSVPGNNVTLRGIFVLTFWVLEEGCSPYRQTDFHAEYVKRRASSKVLSAFCG